MAFASPLALWSTFTSTLCLGLPQPRSSSATLACTRALALARSSVAISKRFVISAGVSSLAISCTSRMMGGLPLGLPLRPCWKPLALHASGSFCLRAILHLLATDQRLELPCVLCAGEHHVELHHTHISE